jgi:hypothetical protein
MLPFVVHDQWVRVEWLRMIFGAGIPTEIR